MKISSLNNIYNPSKVNFKATPKVKLNLPNPSDYKIISSETVWKKQQELQEEYRQQLKTKLFPDNKLDDRIKKFLDETKFDFENCNGAIENKTIGEKLAEAILRKQECEGELYHATFSDDIAQKIIKEGFNPEFILRTKCGPGFYFTPSEGDARNYGSSVLKVHCKGKQAHLKNNYYEDITDKSNIKAKLHKYLDFNSSDYLIGIVQAELCTRIINEYCRNYLANELEVDISYATSGRTAAIVVHNLDAIKEIKKLGKY